MTALLLFTTFSCFCSYNVQSANILAVFVIPSISHQVVFQPIWRALAERGHHVTVLTPNPLKDPKLTNLIEIDLSFTYEILRKDDIQSNLKKDLPMKLIVESIYQIFGNIVELELAHPPVQSLIHDKTKTFDVMLVEFLHPTMYALSARFNCPMIGVTSLGTMITGHDAVGNPSHPALNPDILLPFTDEMGFYERLYSAYYAVWFRYYYRSRVLPEQDRVARKYIGEDIPYLGDIERNVSMIFLNVNPIIHPIRPNVPAVIELGKMHIQIRKPLPKPIWKELSLRGHEVTVLTPNPLNDPALVNLTEIDLGFAYEIIKRNNLQHIAHIGLSLTQLAGSFFEMMAEMVEAELRHPPVQALLRDETKEFDLVLVEFHLPTVFALGARFNCPIIGISSTTALTSGHDLVGNPSHPSLNPDIWLPFTGKLGFFDRVYSTYFVLWFRYHYHNYVLPEQDKIARKYISKDMPYLGSIERNISLLFLNVNPIMHAIRPNVPAIIELGTMCRSSKKELPVDLQKELDAAKEGVIYFSLGSNVRSANLTLDLRGKILKALSELPYKVLWKWEEDHLPGQPKNVITRKWLPQQDVLGHPNIKAFVTQGGLQSMEEAISNGVPLIGMPIFGDQPLNVRKMINLGIAQSVDPETLTSEELKAAIVEVAENPKYRNRIREISNLVSDVPMTGLEKAVWWTEYVIRHKGARHLRSPALDMPWYQYLLLDVVGFVLAVVLISLFVAYKVLSLLFKFGRSYLGQSKVKTS